MKLNNLRFHRRRPLRENTEALRRSNAKSSYKEVTSLREGKQEILRIAEEMGANEYELGLLSDEIDDIFFTARHMSAEQGYRDAAGSEENIPWED